MNGKETDDTEDTEEDQPEAKSDSWLARWEAQVDEEIRTYLDNHRGDQYDTN